jgi:mannonate dehydratase
MVDSTRRVWLKQNLAVAAAITTIPALSGEIIPLEKGIGKIQLCELLSLKETDRLTLCKQVGVTHVITGAPFWGIGRDQYEAAAKKMVDGFAEIGFKIAGIEGHPVPFEKIKLGLEGRDEEIRNTNAAIEALSKAGIDMICYNFMAGLGWYRTKYDVHERGDALTSEFDLEDSKKQGLTQWGEVSEEKMWDNLTYFLERIMPVAEKYKVKMAAHPDDPPVSPLRGISRILTSAENFSRLMNIAPSPMNGVTFCQANFKAMGEDIYKLAKEFGDKGKLFFVHFRDIEGTKEHFHETFHDNGPTDMAKMIKIYSDSGLVIPMRPDHAPTLFGESEESKGYGMQGKLFAFGYMKGLMQAQGINYE